MTTRRAFLQSLAAAAGAALVPSWLVTRQLSTLDLSAFCWHGRWPQRIKCNIDGVIRDVGTTTPFAQMGVVDDAIGRKDWQQRLKLPGSHFEPFKYATDGAICIRVPATDADLTGEQRPLPPAYALDWTHGWKRRGKWLPWPKAAYLDGSDTYCPVCVGTGCREGCVADCERCDGCGQVWVGSHYHLSRPAPCPSCNGSGHAPILDPCPACKGQPISRRPAFQQVGNIFVDCERDRKIRAGLDGVEYFLPADGLPEGKPIRFRAGGEVRGLLMPVDRKRAAERMRT